SIPSGPPKETIRMASYEAVIEISALTCDRSMAAECCVRAIFMLMPRASLKSFLISTLILAGTATPGLALDGRWAGFLFDRSCADNAKAQGIADAEFLHSHKKECALNEGCSKDGYAVYSKGKWLQLDKKGSELARKMLSSSSTKEGHFVVVSGSLDKDQIKVSSLKELAQQN
ncbi:MAG: hypothetical protein K2X27_28300, partial [Candidatus Obscuribacterales bacterium]|nr:hypothetical protein [Candidatus Obscuribacterales bacterium]